MIDAEKGILITTVLGLLMALCSFSVVIILNHVIKTIDECTRSEN